VRAALRAASDRGHHTGRRCGDAGALPAQRGRVQTERDRQLRRPRWLSSFMMTDRRSSWFARTVQLCEMPRSAVARRIEISASRPRSW